MPGPKKLNREQLEQHHPAKIPNSFVHREDGSTEIHVTQRNGRQHCFTMESRMYFALFDSPSVSFHASPQTAKNPHDRWYCKVCWGNGSGSHYLHRLLIAHELTAARPQVDHIQDCTNNCRSNLRPASSKENLANRTMPTKEIV